MNNSLAQDDNRIKQWLRSNTPIADIKSELSNAGYDEAAIEQLIASFKKQKIAERQNIGFTCLAVGAVLGFVSCVLGLLNPFPELFPVFFYGFTSLAACIIFAGLYFLFE